jgi:hypothetical protein
MHAIEKISGDNFIDSRTFYHVFESIELRDKVFNEILDHVKAFQYKESFRYDNEEIFFHHSGDRNTTFTKTEIQVQKEGMVEEDVYSIF